MSWHIDFETRSEIDLTKCGLHNYARGKHADIMCMAYGRDEGEIKLWKPGMKFPFELMEALIDGEEIIAHNAQFELEIWNTVGVNKYGWPPLPIENTYCNMVMGYFMALPGKLEKLAPAVGLKIEKDMQGNRIMLQLSQPRKEIETDNGIKYEFYNPEEHKEKFDRMYSYCLNDVEVERQAGKRLMPLSPKERNLWLLDQKINQRGVLIDIKSVKKAIEVVGIEKKRLDEEMRELTNNMVASANDLNGMKTWLRVICDIDLKTKTTINKKEEEKETTPLGKSEVSDLLRKKDLHPKARRALEIRQEAGKSSTAKLNSMILRAGKDNRVRHAFQYYGAYSTGRWAGRGLQLQNLPRTEISFEDVESVIKILNSNKPIKSISDEIDLMYGRPTNVMSDCIRSFIMSAPGKRFLDCDWNAIEARVLAWLAGEEAILTIFKSHGKIYEHAASGIYKVPITHVNKDQRQIGKVAILALGYGGGVGAFQSMAKVYGVKVPDKQAEEIKKNWREANPFIVKYWADLERAAIAAVNDPGKIFAAGAKGRQVKYRVVGSFLWCLLPSGRAISYPYPKVEMVETPWGEQKPAVTFMSEDSNTSQWTRQKTYGGFFSENITQATSRDILAEALIRLEDNNYPVIMHVHDEVVCEVDNDFGSLEEMSKLMCVLPTWAEGLPLAAGGWEGTRFRKD